MSGQEWQPTGAPGAFAPPTGYPAGVPTAGGYPPPGAHPWPGEQPWPGSFPPPGGQLPGAPWPPGHPLPEPRQPKLPVVPRLYHEFWRAPGYRWWRGLVALIAAAAGFGIMTVAATLVAFGVDSALGNSGAYLSGDVKVTPALFIANNVGLGLLIPVCMLAAWISGQRPRWLSSVAGGLRWRWLGWAALAIVPLWLAYFAIDTWLSGGLPSSLARNPNTVVTLVGILTTTVFQCAGEEYLCRGLITRAVASWIPRRWLGFALATLVSGGVFTLLHGAGDVWLNIFYFSFAAFASAITLRTGGLEAAIVLHCVNNLLSEATMPWTDYSDMFKRDAGAGSPMGLVVLVAMAVVWVAIEWLARRKKPLTANDPGARELATGPLPSGGAPMTYPPGFPYPPNVPYPVGPGAGHPQPGVPAQAPPGAPDAPGRPIQPESYPPPTQWP